MSEEDIVCQVVIDADALDSEHRECVAVLINGYRVVVDEVNVTTKNGRPSVTMTFAALTVVAK